MKRRDKAAAKRAVRPQPGRIDDTVGASFEAWPAEPVDFGKKAGELALSFAGLTFLPARAAKILHDQLSSGKRFARIEYLFNAFRIKLRQLESGIEARFANLEDQGAQQREAVRVLQAKLDETRFQEAVQVACEESARASDLKKVERFTSILVGSLTPGPWSSEDEDVASMIRDVAQLGEKDLRVLAILKTVHASAISTAPNLYEPDPFSRETPTLNRAISDAGFHRDDFLSICERLRGFGLAAEVLRNTSHMAPHDYCYRPTRRGLVVLDYLGIVSVGSGGEAAAAM